MLVRGWLVSWLLLPSAVAGRRQQQKQKTHRSRHPSSRHVDLINRSGETLRVEWVHPETGETVPFGDFDDGIMELDSFVNHTFVIHRLEEDNTKTKESCGSDGSCKALPSMMYLTVSDDKEQFVVIKENFELEMLDDPSSAFYLASPTTAQVVAEQAGAGPSSASRLLFPPSLATKAAAESRMNATAETEAIISWCRVVADNALFRNPDKPAKAVQALTACLEERTAEVLQKKNEEMAFQASLRQEMSAKAENYTCLDPNRQTSPAIENRTWTHFELDTQQQVTRNIRVLHNRPSSQIHLLENFISPAECDAIHAAAEDLLHRGTVADGKGGSRLSDSRKAWQAGIKVDHSAPNNPIAAVQRRLFDYANDVTGYNMTLPGQEDLMSIQYFHRGRYGNEDPSRMQPDRYMPHCDGDCDGMPHKWGGRVATMVMYCDAPELGGGTNFQNSNVFVKPLAGAAAFFSYLDPVTHIHEQGFTSHSGCPVQQGIKRIAVQWMRIGVDEENPWDSFDTNTISRKVKEELSDEEAETEEAASCE